MIIDLDNTFDTIDNLEKSTVFQIFPDVYGDSRGYFSEVMKSDMTIPVEVSWLTDFSWIKQFNRSSSSGNVIRGMHAQIGSYCQAKLVEAITETIFDVIIDARPDSKTFGISRFYELDPIKQNKLFVPRGFLHGFIVPSDIKTPAIFNYYCDNTFNKESEIGISPATVLPRIADCLAKDPETAEKYGRAISVVKDENIKYSEKDANGVNYLDFMLTQKIAYSESGKLWYR